MALTALNEELPHALFGYFIVNRFAAPISVKCVVDTEYVECTDGDSFIFSTLNTCCIHVYVVWEALNLFLCIFTRVYKV